MARVLPAGLPRLQEAEQRRMELQEVKRKEIKDSVEKKKLDTDRARQYSRQAAELRRELVKFASLRARSESRKSPKPPKTPPRPRKPSMRPSSACARHLQSPPELLESSGAAKAVRAHYDGREDLGKISRRLQEEETAAQNAAAAALEDTARECCRRRHLLLGWDRLKEGWHEAVLRRDATRSVVLMLRRMLNQEQVRCWNSWAEMMFEATTRYTVMDQAARTFLNRHLKRGFLGWYAFYGDRMREFDAIRGVVTNRMMSGLSKCFEKWQAAIEDAARVHDTLHAVMTIMNKALVQRAWQSWADTCELARRVNKAFFKSRLKRGRNRWCAFRDAFPNLPDVVPHWRNRELSKGFMTWRTLVEEETQAREVIVGLCLEASLKRQVANSWCRWRSSWYASHLERMARLRAQQKIDNEERLARERWKRLEALRAIRAKRPAYARAAVHLSTLYDNLLRDINSPTFLTK